LSKATCSVLFVVAFLLILALISPACGSGGGQMQEGQGGESTESDVGEVSGNITVEGSSTVQPITQAAVEAFSQQNPDVQISVGGAGSDDGFEALCSGEAQIADTSRLIDDEEAESCQDNGIEFIELPVATDGITIVVNSQNDFANDITLDELRTLWGPDADGQITTWNQVRSDWPEQQINLYGPSTESDTFEFFTERAVGKKQESRSDYQASEDDNVLVQEVSGDPNALGYFEFGYFEQNQRRLKALEIDGVASSVATIQSGQYPLARPLLIYVSMQALDQDPSVEKFVSFYLENLDQYVDQARYVELSDLAAQETQQRFQNRVTGTATGGEKDKEEEKG
jgi:phosphate transport system substrate-binding protein